MLNEKGNSEFYKLPTQTQSTTNAQAVAKYHSQACHWLMGFLTPNSSLWFHKEHSHDLIQVSLLCLCHKVQSFPVWGSFQNASHCTLSFYRLDPRSAMLAPAVLNICLESSYLFFFPYLLSCWLFPTPKFLDKMGLATSVCLLPRTRSFTFYNIPQHRE